MRWLVTGMAVGLGASVWAQRKLKSVASRYQPSGLAGNAVTKAKGVPAEVVAAIREGRLAMKEKEAELRSGPDARTN
jgi:hypothetical protein